MIIKGKCCCNGAFFTKHLLNTALNGYVRLADIRGLAAKNIGHAFYEMKAVASGTRCKNFFYHAHINPLEHERLTPEQWDQAVDKLENELGLAGQARFVVEHNKKGRIHRHIVWSRIDVDRMKAIPNDDDYEKHQAVARQLEREFGLEQGKSVLGAEAEKGKRPERQPKSWEVFRGQVKGVNVKDLKEEITRLWVGADSIGAFISALEGQGYILAQGDSRAFCIVDRYGHAHSLARQIKGVKAADIGERFSKAGIDPKTFPHVNVAAAYQREKEKAHEAKQESDKQEQVQKEDQQRQEAVAQEEGRREQAVKEEDSRQKQAVQEEEQRREAGLAEETKRQAQFKEQADKQTELAEQMRAQREWQDKYNDAMASYAARERQQAEQRQREEREARSREGEIRNAHSRYGQALGQHYSIRDPYESLARSAMAEYGAFLRDRDNLDRLIARTSDPVERQRLELRKQIEAAEYMSITSERIAGQSEIIVGKLNSPEAVRQRERAQAFKDEAQALRQEYRDLGGVREQGKEQGGNLNSDASAKTPEPPQQAETSRQTPIEQEKPKPARAPETEASSIKVEERAQGRPNGAEQKLSDYIGTLPEKAPHREFTKEELRNNPEARKIRLLQEGDEKSRGYALDNIAKDLKAGKNLNAKDIRRLSRDDLEGIKRDGDKHLKTIVQQHEQQKEKDRGLER